MISINYPEGSKTLAKEELLLLQKACHLASETIKNSIYNLRVYYSKHTDAKLIEDLRTELEQYQKLRILFEDLESLNG